MSEDSDGQTVREWASTLVEETYNELKDEEQLDRPEVDSGRYEEEGPNIAWTGEDRIYRNINSRCLEYDGTQQLELEGNAWRDDKEEGKRYFSGSLTVKSAYLPEGSLEDVEQEIPEEEIEQDIQGMYEAVSALDEENLVFESGIDVDPDEDIDPY